MHKSILSLALAALFTLPAVADDERVEHYRGEPAASLTEALGNLAEYNQQLRALVDKGQLSGDDFHQIHQLTYTLENALGRLDDELDAMQEDLENIHLASERGEAGRILQAAPEYFRRSDELLQ